MTVRGKTVLFCVLNWGLGHATRSLPIIRHLRKNNCNVIIASDGDALVFLKREFPNNQFYELPPYNVHYKISPVWGTILSLYGILRSVNRENTEISKIVQRHSVDVVVSDNRYGVFSDSCMSYLLTHQLNPFFFVKPPFISVLLEYLFANRLNRFKQILIPDDTLLNLSGKMSENRFLKSPLNRIGVLNRFDSNNSIVICKDIDILVVLSGPEPSRSIFETYIFSELYQYSGSIVVVLGRNLKEGDVFAPQFDIRGFVDTNELQRLFCSARVIVSRSGYSSIMDYISLGLNAILIPTPGMPEQEYLADLVGQKGYFKIAKQEKGTLRNTLLESDWGSRTIEFGNNMFSEVF